MDIVCIFLILGSMFYAARIILDTHAAAQELDAEIEVCEHRAEHAARQIDEESRQKTDITARVMTLRARVKDLQERVNTAHRELDAERSQEERIQLALSKRKVQSARSRRVPQTLTA